MAARGLVVEAVRRWNAGPVSFEASAGEFVAVTGGDRTGKSSIIGVLAGYDRPDSGRVLLDGVSVHEMPSATLERRVGWLGAVIPKPGRSRRQIPKLVVGDDPEAPFVVELERSANVFTAMLERERLDRRLSPLLTAIRFLCDQQAIVVVGTRHRVLLRAADRVVTL